MREKVLNNLAAVIAKKPWWTALVLLIITIIMAGMSAQLELTTSFTNLLPQDNPMVDEFNMIIDEYDGSSSMLIVVEGESDKLEEFAEIAVPKIEALSEWVSRVDYKAPKEFIAEHGLMLMKASDLENKYCQLLIGVTTKASNVFADFSNNTITPIKIKPIAVGSVKIKMMTRLVKSAKGNIFNIAV